MLILFIFIYWFKSIFRFIWFYNILYVRSRLSSYASQNDQSSSPQNPAQKPKSQRFRWAALGSPGPHGLKRFALHSYQQPPHGQWSRCWRCPWSGANTMPQGVTCNHGMGKWWNHDENEGKSGHNLHPSHNDGCGAVKVFKQQRLFSLTWTACQREDNILTPKGHCGVEIATATICAIFVHEHLEVTSYDKLIAGFHQRTKFWLHGLQDRLPVRQTLDPLPLFHHLTLSLPSLRNWMLFKWTHLSTWLTYHCCWSLSQCSLLSNVKIF